MHRGTLDEVRSEGLRTLRTPDRAPKVNAWVERLVGTLRRECLDPALYSRHGHLEAPTPGGVPSTLRPRLSVETQVIGWENTVLLSVMLSTQTSKPEGAAHPESFTMKASEIVALPWQVTAVLQLIW